MTSTLGSCSTLPKFRRKATRDKVTLSLRHNYAGGVVIVFPHSLSHKGNEQHWVQEKENKLAQVGEQKFVEGLVFEHYCSTLGLNFLKIPWTEYRPISRNNKELPPDIFYPCDSYLSLGEESLRVYTPTMGAHNRREETNYMDGFFSQYQVQKWKPKAGAKLEGGDTLTFKFGNSWYSILGKRNRKLTPEGKDVRTNKEGRKDFTKFLESSLPNFRGTVTTPHSALHIGTSCEIVQTLPNEPLWIIHNKWLLDPGKLVTELTSLLNVKRGFIKSYQVNKDCDWSAPVLTHEGRALVQQGFPSTVNFLEEIGFEVKQIPWEYHMLTDGNFRCALQPVPGGLRI